jgi:hypothetical protein
VYFPFEVKFPNIKFAIFGKPARGGGLNKNPTVWLDGARLANTCIPPSFMGSTSVQRHGIPTPQYVCKYFKNGKILLKSLLIMKKIRETVATNSLLALNLKFCDSTGPMNSVSSVDLWQCSIAFLSSKMQQILLMQMHL